MGEVVTWAATKSQEQDQELAALRERVRHLEDLIAAVAERADAAIRVIGGVELISAQVAAIEQRIERAGEATNAEDQSAHAFEAAREREIRRAQVSVLASYEERIKRLEAK